MGDCYVAATGLPIRKKDHAVVMARFARQCLIKFRKLVKELEVTLGPDTADLGLRVGIHSGPVTAGVLRGERARFQLFGDSMNTTARIETTGAPNRIHVSKETADLLKQAGKERWLTIRSDRVVAKGKGELQTYWLDVKRTRSSTNSSGNNSDTLDSFGTSSGSGALDDAIAEEEDEDEGEMLRTTATLVSNKMHRLVKWNADLLAKSLKEIVAHRNSEGVRRSSLEEIRRLEEESRTSSRACELIFDEVVEIIDLPQREQGSATPGARNRDISSVELASEVELQLVEFVRTISAMYHDRNPFHNFEHISHVAMSTSKVRQNLVTCISAKS